MRNRSHRVLLGLAGAAALTTLVAAQPSRQRLNPVIALLEEHKPVFGLYIPSNRGRGPGPPGAGARTEAAPRTPQELAAEALAYRRTDFLFDGSMEGGLQRGLPGFSAFVEAMLAAGHRDSSGRLTHALIVKTPELDQPTIHQDIATQLNLGVSGLMLPRAESAEQVVKAIAAMRFVSRGGTRPESDLGFAPAFWGMSAAEYKAKADLWPLNPEGELINWTIIESREGLARVREIAAVKGIGVLWPGSGTLRGLFTTTTPEGERRFDEKGWEAAIQTVLAACKEFKVACGIPAGPKDIEMRMKQGFSVFVMPWGETGFQTIEIGRKAGHRSTD